MGVTTRFQLQERLLMHVLTANIVLHSCVLLYSLELATTQMSVISVGLIQQSIIGTSVLLNGQLT